MVNLKNPFPKSKLQSKSGSFEKLEPTETIEPQNTDKLVKPKPSTKALDKNLLDSDKDKPKLKSKPKKPLLIILGIFLFYLVLIVYSLIIGFILKKDALLAVDNVKASMTAIQNKNLDEVSSNLQLAHQNLDKVESKYKLLTPIRFIPPLGGYINDGRHGILAAQHSLDTAEIIIEAIKPYADVIGFATKEGETEAQSAEDKIVFILETLDKISPQLETIGGKVALIEEEISQINPRRYPKSIAGKQIRSQLTTIQASLASTKETLANIKPLTKLLPKLLGHPKPQKYLLIFQNDAEIRGSGGFLTAYAILEANRGKITPLDSQDIYTIDNRFGNRLPAPDPIKKYLPLVNNWHLRDMNLSPDFTESMDVFIPNFKDVASSTSKYFDGVIAIDTQFPVGLLQVLGKVGVANWGEYHAEIVEECNCPQVVYKMEDYATRPTHYVKQDRKGMIGPLMHSILLNVMNSPKRLWPQFIEIGLKNIKEKHLMFYFPDDEDMQEVAESFNASGTIQDYDKDYFHLNDTNFAGAKSNLYVEQEIDQEIEVASDGTITKTVTIVYTNPQPPDDCNLESGALCLNGLLRDWVRIYVPEGSELVEILGSDIDATTSKDLGKTVFEAFIELRPESKTKLIVKYTLPFKHETGDYQMLIQKQPGAKNHQYTINLGNTVKEFALDGDIELSL